MKPTKASIVLLTLLALAAAAAASQLPRRTQQDWKQGPTCAQAKSLLIQSTNAAARATCAAEGVADICEQEFVIDAQHPGDNGQCVMDGHLRFSCLTDPECGFPDQIDW
ncbi:MAG: hypothetical protein MPN21_19020 [Thermoanaerobaculia bacterium]|nr:hypothetical protein [Thermoanaerobaculia bacterium]